ncbi:MAG: hypothetical protein EXQ86_10455, partial [Rhodospirillales bacterium]|nr:hypothetical protein [Rhodospirillales bacterium]
MVAIADSAGRLELSEGSAPTFVLEGSGDGAVNLPEGLSLANATFTPAGDNLVATWPDGSQVVVRDYFSQPDPPALVGADGAQVSGTVVSQLAGADGPGQVAQESVPSVGADSIMGRAVGGTDGEPIGQVEHLAGTVWATRADGTRVQLKMGDSVFQGDALESGADSAVGIMLADETTFSMAENGKMVLDEMVFDPSTQDGKVSLSVLQGVFTFVSGQVAKTDPDAMTLNTPVATIGIRGTQVGLDLSDGQNLNIVLMQERDGFIGEVTVVNQGGSSVLNGANSFTMVNSFTAAPAAVTTISTDRMVQQFGDSLKSLPMKHGNQNDFGMQKDTTQKAAEAAAQAAAAAAAAQAAVEAAAAQAAAASAAAAAAAAAEAARQAAAEAAAQAAFQANPLSNTTRTLTQNFSTSATGVNLEYGAAVRPLNITGSAFDDTITTGSGNDKVDGGAGDDVLNGGTGDDRLVGGVGNDTLIGGAGQDTAVFGGNRDDYAVTIDQATGKVTIANTVTIGIDEVTGEITVTDDDATRDGTDVLLGIERISFDDGDIVLGGAGSDTLVGSDGNDLVIGGAGSDVLFGGSGDDTIIGGAGNDIITGGAGNDVIVGGSGSDTAVFTGTMLGYKLDIDKTTGEIILKNPNGEIDTLVDVEALQFGDAEVAVGAPPTATAADVAGNEDTAIALDITAAGATTLTDIDYVTISGIPAGAMLSAGTDSITVGADGVAKVDPAQLANLAITPPLNSSADFTLTVTATNSIGVVSASDTVLVDVAAVSDAFITATVTPEVKYEDTRIPLNITAGTDDPSENLGPVQVSGIPAGAKIHVSIDGVTFIQLPVVNGTVSIPQSLSHHVTVTPPANSNVDMNLTVSVTSSDAGPPATQALFVDVKGVAETPALNVADVTGLEDTGIRLNIGAATADHDGSETLTVNIQGVPAGGTLNYGTHNADGSWTLTSADLAAAAASPTGLTVTPAANSSADFNLVVTATTTENDGDTKSVTGNVHVDVTAVADTPTLTLVDVTGNEDARTSFHIDAGVTDPSETMTIQISGVPDGAKIFGGTDDGAMVQLPVIGGVVQVPAAFIHNLAIQPPLNSDVDIPLTVTVTSHDEGQATSVSSTLNIDVTAVADAPTLNVGPASGLEDTGIRLNIGAALTDTDGLEVLSVTISGIPAGASIHAGTDTIPVVNGSVLLTPAQLQGLTITPPANSDADFNLTVTALSREAD